MPANISPLTKPTAPPPPEQVSVVHFPRADGRRREADGVRVGAGDALVRLVAVHLGDEARVHRRHEGVEAVGVEQRQRLPTWRKDC